MLHVERDNGMTATILMPEDTRYRGGGEKGQEFYIYDSELVATIKALQEQLKRAHLTAEQKVA